ncbi:MAG: hypothetical protein QOC73_242, partial [Actinomycetota bacterium]|nr:hypothetical protein [Actinomycetota bacterium]
VGSLARSNPTVGALTSEYTAILRADLLEGTGRQPSKQRPPAPSGSSILPPRVGPA